jgi:hypothetical protein
VPSGRIVAADAFFLDTPEFTVKLPAGRHHVLLLHVTAPDFGPRVAAAMIRAGEPSPVKWQGAQIAAAAAGAEPFAYGVDSGTGSFASAEAVERFKAMPSDLATALVDRLLADYKTGGEYRQTATITVDEASGLDIVTFWSGFGDGGYASWFGLDAEGEPVALLTSFDLIDDPTKPTGSPAP